MVLVYVAIQAGYLLALLVVVYFLTREVRYVNPEDAAKIQNYPPLILFYPLLREDKDTIYTTLMGHRNMDYPADRWRMIAVTNWFDYQTSVHIQELMPKFSFLELIIMPPCTDPAWNAVWGAWERNPYCYWWHRGKTQHNRDLPPKKTRQLIYAFYQVDQQMGDQDWILDYIDADSVSPVDHFKLGVVGLQGQYNFIQSTNIAGNLLDSMVASLCAFDHMVWDGFIYPHMSGGHPYYCLGKGLFIRASDVRELGSWNPYITIEDPEVGLRFWKNRRKLGIIAAPLIEEVPRDFLGWLHQRNRWVCGFFQTLAGPLTHMGFTAKEKLLARMNIVPSLSLLLNVVGMPIGLLALYRVLTMGGGAFAWWIGALSFANLSLLMCFLGMLYVVTWKRTRYILNHVGYRLWYMLRINPLVLLIYWTVWTIPLLIGFGMFLTDRGKAWKRTEKVDANHDLIRSKVRRS